MKILAFDTSTKFLSIACLEDADVKAAYHEDVDIRHSEILVAKIRDILDSLNWKLEDIGLMCIGSGPGSFTGLRISIATVKGFAAVVSTKVVAVPVMDAIIRNIIHKKYPEIKTRLAAPFLDARKNKVYTCIYDCCGSEIKRVTDYLLVRVEDFFKELKEEIFFFGDAIMKYKRELDSCPFARYDEHIDWYPRAVEIGRIGLERSLTHADNPETIEPLYLHEKECNIIKATKD